MINKPVRSHMVTFTIQTFWNFRNWSTQLVTLLTLH